MGKPLKILSCTFISLFFLGQVLDAQKKVVTDQSGDGSSGGFTLGVNLEGPIGRIFDSDKAAFSAVTHIKFAQKWFFRGEAGFENLTFSPTNEQERSYTYESNGSFLKAGVLYDFFSVEEKGNNDNIFIGLNYGFAIQEHGSGSYTIENGYWGDFQGSMGEYVLNTHWLEIMAGPRTELLKNLYMGWTINMRIKVLQDNEKVLDPFSVPGFGNGDNTVNVGFSYVIEYFIPWRKNRE
ncbi:DUF6048 family protein [Marinilabilia rubra]|uniref:Outer membrane protein beta-barrel domain-containing protein n=1 Tax=Marinilabilia rubra TaxID=2162893 RepID=A0A2U2B9B9_9BACT|nr:DUF6048 family protein [Marinilabilia rubra]PWD99671.1 hypothetical protein DDZ16_09510 [Marinilabilia rubra]